jgi:hypothetical protein
VNLASDTGVRVMIEEGRAFQLALEPRTYVLTVSMQGYLDAQRAGVVVESGQTVTLGAVTLAGGDANGDGSIDIADAALVAGNLESTDAPEADLNDDGQVDILDLVLVNSNFGLQGPQTWE